MYQSFSDFIKDASASGKDWLKSQLKITLLTFILLAVGLLVIDQAIVPIAWAALIPLIALAIAIVDAIPVIGISACMVPWSIFAYFFYTEENDINRKASLAIFILFLLVLVIRQISEPFIRGYSLGISAWEEILTAVVGYLIFNIFGIGVVGALAGPVIYIIGKKAYVKTNPDGIFKKQTEKPRMNAEKTNKTTVVDITDEVEDVEE